MTKTKKAQVLTLLQRGPELSLAGICKRIGIPHPSGRRILNELRAEGLVSRGSTHGTWFARQSRIVEEVIPVVDATVDDVDPLNIEGREDAPEETVVVVLPLFKVEAEGDIVYFEAPSAEDAKNSIVEALGIPPHYLTVTQIDELPEGEELYTLPTQEQVGVLEDATNDIDA